MSQSDIQQAQSNLDKMSIDEKIEIINNLIEIQKKCVTSKYMIGLYNGLVLAQSILTDKEPLFYEEEERFREMEGMNNG